MSVEEIGEKNRRFSPGGGSGVTVGIPDVTNKSHFKGASLLGLVISSRTGIVDNLVLLCNHIRDHATTIQGSELLGGAGAGGVGRLVDAFGGARGVRGFAPLR